MNRLLPRALGPSLLSLVSLVGATGCATIEVGRPAKGDLPELVRDQRDKERPLEARPIALLIGEFDLRAVDPISEAQLWRRGMPVVGRPAANDTQIFVPVRGQRLVALDRQSGDRQWEVDFEGEVVSGVAANRQVVVVTSTDGPNAYIAGFDPNNGSLLWSKRTEGRLGVPAVVGRIVTVPLEGQLLALTTISGRERARTDMPFPATDWHTVRRQGDSVLVGGEDGFVDVLRPQATPRRFAGTHGPIFRTFERMDPGLDDGGRIQWWTPVPQDGSKPSFGVLMARRAVVGVTLDDHGRPEAIAWVHLAPEADEHVAMDVSYGRVNLVRESGAMLALSTADGRMFAFREGEHPTLGAVLIDHDQFDALGDRRYRKGDKGAVERIYLEAPVAVDERLYSLLADPDPRLWPAQALAVEVVAKQQGDVNQFELAMSLARGEMRADNEQVSRQLRELARNELAKLGHAGVEGELGDPIEGATGVENLALLARQAADAGDVTAVDDLAAHLLHPNTPAQDLGAVARALCALDQPAGHRAMAEFVRLYHADTEAVLESDALLVSLSCLWEIREGSDEARATLAVVDADPFTDPALRDYMDRTFDGSLMAPAPGVEVLADGPPAEGETTAPRKSDDVRPRPPTLPDSGL